LIKEAHKIYKREYSLDGLRGAAAVVVVLHHLLLTLPWFADRVELGNLNPKGEFSFSIHRVFQYTPLHIFYGGTEAVVVFFVLSGYVLVYSVKLRNLTQYVLNRFVRLYIPIVAAVLCAAILLRIQDRKPLTGASWWLNSHAIPFSNSSLIHNFWVLDGTDWMNSSLWSMKYEIIFSLMVLVIAGFAIRNSVPKFFLMILSITVLILIGMQLKLDLLSWIPVFFAGSALHFLPTGYLLNSVPKFILGSIIMFTPWYFAGFGYSLNLGLSRGLMTIGALMIVDSCRQENTFVTKIFTLKPFRLAGKYSYSLYLIHTPILTSVWFAMGFTESKSGWMIRTLISISCIALVTYIIYKVAEEPSLKWIKRRQHL
jgi:peptidoglycan/LPS O-acetylase OafA/YrhL